MYRRSVRFGMLFVLFTNAWMVDSAVAADGEPAPTLSAYGQVVDPDGEPVEGVRVVLREWSNTRYNEDVFNRDVHDILAETTTDEHGSFRFEEVASRPFAQASYNNFPWDVVVLADGHAMAWVHLAQHQSTRPVTIELAPEQSVEGQIVGPNEEPVADAKVRVWSIDPPGTDWSGNYNEPGRIDLSQSQISPTATTDSEGRFLLAGLPADRRMSVMVEHPNYTTDYFYVGTTEGPQPAVKTPGNDGTARPVLQSGLTQ
jgi:protocatechuate 3,4-dioxygenase beta subunit